MSREAFGDPPEQEPQRCPVCDGEWHTEDCIFGQEVALRLKAEREEIRLRAELRKASEWIVLALKLMDRLDTDAEESAQVLELVHTGEVLALTTLANSKRHNVISTNTPQP